MRRSRSSHRARSSENRRRAHTAPSIVFGRSSSQRSSSVTPFVGSLGSKSFRAPSTVLGDPSEARNSSAREGDSAFLLPERDLAARGRGDDAPPARRSLAGGEQDRGAMPARPAGGLVDLGHLDVG